MSLALVVTGFALIVLLDLIPLIRKKDGHGIAAFLLLFSPALVLAVLQAVGVEVPGVTVVLWRILHALGLTY